MSMTPNEPPSDRRELQPLPQAPEPAPAQGRDIWIAFARHYLLAVQRFTRLPIPARLAGWVGEPSPEQLQRSTGHFPGVGWLAGLVTTLVYGGLLVALPGSVFAPLVAAVFCTVATVLLTAGFGEQGLTRLVDALVDTRAATFGAMALTLALLARISLLALLGDSVLTGEDATRACVVVWLAQVLSRGATLLLVLKLPYVGDVATPPSTPLAERVSSASVGTAIAWCAGALALSALELNGRTLVLGLLVLTATLWALQRLLARRLGGFTGDALGATQQACEIALLLGAALAT